MPSPPADLESHKGTQQQLMEKYSSGLPDPGDYQSQTPKAGPAVRGELQMHHLRLLKKYKEEEKRF